MFIYVIFSKTDISSNMLISIQYKYIYDYIYDEYIYLFGKYNIYGYIYPPNINIYMFILDG